ncbi:ATP-binding cassette domain-containing protein [Actinokineospora pegani]|uniref:ATP-binding cassette domain-containing protein n=1 Tax=Actinokineospora pegani TaxID=2654637 RepID=UPI001F3F0D35|nr:ATP-binding cassette domain-containing protein [Actinokineospora pegani]
MHIDTGRWSETVVEGVDLTVPKGQVTALLGESGGGKSMLAAALTGRLPDTAQATGDVLIEGAHVEDWREVRGRTVGLVPQEGASAFTAADTVGAQLRGLEQRHRRWTVERACAAARYPLDALDLYPDQHSSGQVQRAALAAALLPVPGLLIADEPTASLDTGLAYEVWGTLREYADTGAAVLAITHDVHHVVALGVADRMVVLREGRITAAGTPDEIRRLEDPYVQGFFRT